MLEQGGRIVALDSTANLLAIWRAHGFDRIVREAWEQGGYHGHDGVRRWWATLLGTFPDFHAEILEVHDLGDVTIATLRLRDHGAESDTPLDATAWQVTQFRHGRCIRWRVYMSKAEAPRSRGAAGVA